MTDTTPVTAGFFGGKPRKNVFAVSIITRAAIAWSGADNLITADEAIAEHLPPDYIETYGMPPLVRSGADIAAEIAKT